MADIDRDAIAARAYALYVRRGKQPGRAIDDWLEAERQLRVEASGRPPSTGPAQKTLVPGAPPASGRPAPAAPPPSAPAIPAAHAEAAKPSTPSKPPTVSPTPPKNNGAKPQQKKKR